MDEKIEALRRHLIQNEGFTADELPDGEFSTRDDEYFEVCSRDYLVLTDAEADHKWDEALDSYIDDCIMPELKDKTLKQYFDSEAWKRDAKFDGRGHSLSSYDGAEEEQNIDGIWYYIYRIN